MKHPIFLGANSHKRQELYESIRLVQMEKCARHGQTLCS